MNYIKKGCLFLLVLFFTSVSTNSKNFISSHIPQSTHVLLDFWGVDLPDTVEEIENLLREATAQAHGTLLEIKSHKFDPQGITAFALLAESHISIHTWPEYENGDGYVAIDVFACGKDAQPHKAAEYFATVLKPKRVNIRSVERGGTGNPKFGQEVVIDLFDCDPDLICSGDAISEFSKQLCSLLKMEAYGKPFLERFALHDPNIAGYSLAQMITTSLVSGHFSEKHSSAYINIFSCSPFSADEAVEFTKKFFKAQSYKKRVLIR